MTIKLKPCPFCGGEAYYWTHKYANGTTYHFVGCLECAVRTANMTEKQDAVDCWNRRAEDKP